MSIEILFNKHVSKIDKAIVCKSGFILPLFTIQITFRLSVHHFIRLPWKMCNIDKSKKLTADSFLHVELFTFSDSVHIPWATPAGVSTAYPPFCPASVTENYRMTRIIKLNFFSLIWLIHLFQKHSCSML